MERIGRLYDKQNIKIYYDIFKDEYGREFVEVLEKCYLSLKYFDLNCFEKFEEIKK